MNPSILLIYTGGTIGMKTDPATGVLTPFDFNDIYEEFPYLKYLGVSIEVINFKPIDSSNVTPELWIKLAKVIYENYHTYDGFVVLHGTDTMSYTASALSFMLGNICKPVVFTGSQIPIGVIRSDGRENLVTAIEIAAAKKDGRPVVPEVCLYFQNKLFRANRTTKYSAEDFDAFRSENYPSLADVGVKIHYHHKYIMSADENSGPDLCDSLSTDVSVVRLFPGISGDTLRAMLSAEHLKGIILQTYGSGNAPTFGWFYEVLTEAVDRGMIILNVTQCSNGSVDMDIYETGLRLQDAGVISGRDITTEAALTKMMYLLGQDLKREVLRERLKRSLRGEISE